MICVCPTMWMQTSSEDARDESKPIDVNIAWKGKGEMIGTGFIMSRRVHPISAMAMDDVEVFRVTTRELALCRQSTKTFCLSSMR